MDNQCQLERKKNLLAALSNKQLTYEEFMREISYWALESLDELRPYNLPIKPNEIEEYEQLSEIEKRKVKSTFWEEPAIKDYLEKKQWVMNKNRGNLYWLQEYFKHIPEEDINSRQRISSVISQHNITNERVEQIKGMFGGSVIR